MDPIENPYTPNAGARPPELAGREAQLEQFRILVGRLSRGNAEQSMIIRGPRGVGKTVLLNAFEDQAEAAGFLTCYHEMVPGIGLIQELTRDSQAALARLKLSKRVRDSVRDALSRLSIIKMTVSEGIELSVDMTSAREADISSDLSELFLALGAAAAQKGKGIVFLLDEVQFAAEIEFRAVISALHRVTQRRLPVTVVAAGLPQIPRLTGEARSYAERLFTFPVIGNLGDEAASSALIEAAKSKGVGYTDRAIAKALEWTAGYPFYLQQLGKHAWNLASRSPIDIDVIEEAVPIAQSALDSSIYAVRIQRATDQERRYMRGMAELGSGPYRSGEVARKFGKSTTAVSRLRQNLVEKGLIYATEDFGYLEFTIPRFDEFLLRQPA